MTPHHEYIRHCNQLAIRGYGNVGNGALVGSVLVRHGEIIAEGFHEGFGAPHAEAALLHSYTGPIKPDDVLYVNLEPCCHRGKTPPCTNVIIERGVKHVVYGMLDPDTRVAGQGIVALQKADIHTIGPILPEECQRLNRGYVSVREKGRPWITLKKAQTKDGRIAHDDGSMLKITNEQQDRWSHTFLRNTHDAILVGIGTILADNPRLNTRFVQDKSRLLKIILDPHGKTPVDAHIIGTAPEDTIIVVGDANQENAVALKEHGATVLTCPMNDERFDLSALMHLLIAPNDTYIGITSILVEGGPTVWQSFQKAGIVDEEITLVG